MLLHYTKKILATFLVFLLVVISFPWQSTLAYFSDEESSEQNSFVLGSLDFSLNSPADFDPAVTPTIPATRQIAVINDGTLDFQYRISAVNFSGSLCDYLDLTATLNDSSVYTGALSSFTDVSVGVFNNSADWVFDITLTDADLGLQNETCTFDFVYTGWQDNLPDETAGFFDIETISNTVNSGSWNGVVLNEILPNPEGYDDQVGIQGEWVELYNNSDHSVDLTGWYIEDDSSSGHRQTISTTNTYNGRTVIGAPGSYLEWLVIFMNGSILNNTGDTVSLYDSNDNLIDSYTFTDSNNDTDSDSNNTPGGDNQNGVGDETAGNEGKSYARIPDGVGEWVDPIPTPGWANILEETEDSDTTNENNEEIDNNTDDQDVYFDLSNSDNQSIDENIDTPTDDSSTDTETTTNSDDESSSDLTDQDDALNSSDQDDVLIDEETNTDGEETDADLPVEEDIIPNNDDQDEPTEEIMENSVDTETTTDELDGESAEDSTDEFVEEESLEEAADTTDEIVETPPVVEDEVIAEPSEEEIINEPVETEEETDEQLVEEPQQIEPPTEAKVEEPVVVEEPVEAEVNN